MSHESAKRSGILLDTGTNELEVVEFTIGDCYYGINVAKIREIIRSQDNIVKVPDSHDSLEGAINLRGKIIPVINLVRHLKIAKSYDRKISRIIVAEFNNLIVGFWVSSVTHIYRLSWKQMEAPSDLVQSRAGYAVAVVKIEDRIVFLLDLEKIAADVNPRASLQAVAPNTGAYLSSAREIDRTLKNILVVEDSAFVRDMLLDHLKQAGYRTQVANNGEEAWDYLVGLTKARGFSKIDDHVQLMITDIEMPQMDGLHLIKRIKNDDNLQKLPCLVFSSMISKELSLKCKAVGADGEISKPQIGQLVDLLDSKVL